MAARAAGVWGGEERGGRVSIGCTAPVCPRFSGAGKEKERRPKWAAFGKQLRT
ncbi:hypothetical protein HMPREF0239_05159 [Clostridium sp. ATCC BAA-442]|nr:hypothetical protein HMPREF0239_05159 [Clostridium sp. ATCC BAA-442]